MEHKSDSQTEEKVEIQEDAQIKPVEPKETYEPLQPKPSHEPNSPFVPEDKPEGGIAEKEGHRVSKNELFKLDLDPHDTAGSKY